MKLEKMVERRRKHLKELRCMDSWIAGSLVVTERKLAGGERPFRYLSRSIDGKNRITYVSKNQAVEFGRQLKTARRAEWLFREISELTISIVKSTSDDAKGEK